MNCRVCSSTRLETVVDLGRQPWCNGFLKKEELGREPVYPLRVVFCRDCAAAQLDHTVKKEVMFGDHTYLSGTTQSLSAHFRALALEVDQRFLRGRAAKSVLDIGSNDGTQLKHFQALGCEVLGVESSRTTARIALAAGVPTVNVFFNQKTRADIGRQFDVINAAGVFFHLEELHSAAEGVREGLKSDGVFVVQFLYMKCILENTAFDQIYHEHLLYYTLKTLETLLGLHGLELFDARLAPIHGGSMIAFAGPRGRRRPSAELTRLKAEEDAAGANSIDTYRLFYGRIQEMKRENLAYLAGAKNAGKRVFGFGAPAKGNTLLNYFGIGADLVECLVEKNELRRGLYSPGRHIPVVIERELTGAPDVYYVLAWNFRDEILANNQALLNHGVEFYFPVRPAGVT